MKKAVVLLGILAIMGTFVATPAMADFGNTFRTQTGQVFYRTAHPNWASVIPGDPNVYRFVLTGISNGFMHFSCTSGNHNHVRISQNQAQFLKEIFGQFTYLAVPGSNGYWQ